MVQKQYYTDYAQNVEKRNKMKKTFILILTIFLVMTGCSNDKKSDKITIVSTIFPGYDFARAVGGDNVDITMLVKPGSESHAYDPTPKDIIKIQQSDIFIYVGGESEEWVKDILNDISSKTKVIRLMDLVEVKEEETVEGMEAEDHADEEEFVDEGEYDEHVWTSPINAIKIVKSIENSLVEIDKSQADYYKDNAEKYIAKIKKIDEEIKDILINAKRNDLVFADRFPFRYFVDEYNLNYRAAFSGCSSETEASAKTIAYLVDYVKNNNIPVVLYIELSNQKLADTLVEETGAKKMEFQSVHNVTEKEFKNGITYVDIMEKNILTLKEALN